MRLLLGGLHRALSTMSPGLPRLCQEASKKTSFEQLEERCLLAGDVLATIGGTVYNDLSGNGVTADDVGIKGVELTLYRDGGNGVFDGAGGGDDIEVAVTTTGGAGSYRFAGLDVGTYFVQQAAIVGYADPGSAAVQSIEISAADLEGVLTTPIDTFETPQIVGASNVASRTGGSSELMSEALGGERDIWTELTTPYGIIGVRVHPYQTAGLHFDSSIVGDGLRVVTWDGVDGDAAALNPVGLGGHDLTEGGTAEGLRFATGADLDGGQLRIRVYSDGDNWSEAVLDIPNTGSLSQLPAELRFADFAVGAGNGADFESVGAVQLEIVGVEALDGSVSPLQTYGPTRKIVDFVNVEPIDISIQKTDNPDPVVVGEELTYTLDVTNNSQLTATGVTVTDTLPAEVTYKTADAGTGAVQHFAGVVVADLGTLVPGETKTVTIIVTVNLDAPDQILNVAEVIANEAEITLINNVDDEPTVVVRPDSSISGFVYVDADDDGVFDSGETPLENVEVVLSGVDFRGNTVTRRQLTASNGGYSFTQLLPGSYTVDETQPARYADGKDTPGRALNSLTLLTFGIADDVFTSIGLAGGVDAVEFNFGELHHELSKRDFFLASS